jgi:uncharacterized protein (TIGR03086 family)
MIDNRPAALAGGLGLLERALGYTLGSLQGVTAPALSRPTPCAGWDLRTLLAHMDDSLAALHEAATVGAVDAVHAGGTGGARGGDDPVARLRDRACRLLGAWMAVTGDVEVSVADRRLTTGLVTGVGALEVVVHGWDVARACGRNRPIPPALAEELLDLSVLFVDEADRPARFAPAVPLPPRAGPGERLLAFLGRRSD